MSGKPYSGLLANLGHLYSVPSLGLGAATKFSFLSGFGLGPCWGKLFGIPSAKRKGIFALLLEACFMLILEPGPAAFPHNTLLSPFASPVNVFLGRIFMQLGER